MDFKGTLIQQLQQPVAVEACMKAMQDTGGGILASFTGSGKTTMALWVACELKLKTLIVVNKTVLLEQWQDRIQKFVPGAKVGIIQGPVCNTEGMDVVVAMLQSLSQKEYDMKGFGLAIVDECNHVAAPTFSQAMLQINCPYMLGLSATPERKDGLTRVLLWFLGPIFFTLRRHNQERVLVDIKDFDCHQFRLPPPTRFGKLNFEGVVEVLCNSESRNMEIVKRLLVLEKHRKTLVLSARRPHCERLAELLQVAGMDAQVYLGGMHRQRLECASNAQVIVATYSMAAEGLDIPALNTLLLATPKKDVVQACGRVMRGEGGSVDPMILDIKDNWKCTLGQFYGRCRYYKEAGYRFPHSHKSPIAGCNFI